MKPREMYSGAAPAAMGMMGQGLAEVGANIGRITQQGYESMGKSIGQGLQAVGQAYADYKKMSSDIKASEGFYDSMKKGGYLPEAMQNEIDTKINSDEFKNSSTADKAAYWNNIKSFAGQSIAHKWSMDKIAAEQTGANKRKEMDIQVEKNRPFGVVAANTLGALSADGGTVPQGPKRTYGSGGGLSGGALPTDSGDINLGWTGGTATPAPGTQKAPFIGNLVAPTEADAAKLNSQAGGVTQLIPGQDQSIDLNAKTAFENLNGAAQSDIANEGFTPASWNALTPDERNAEFNKISAQKKTQRSSR